MNKKILLIALSAAALSSCSTAYKSGQTPDDVYYSPVPPAKPKVEREDPQERYVAESRNRTSDYRIMMSIRDSRWRDLDNEYDYGYDYQYSPYSFSSGYTNYGYYYNPCYNTWPVYAKVSVPVNTTPRRVNLNTYSGYNTAVAPGNKSAAGVMWTRPSATYNNSNSAARQNVRRADDSYYRQPTEQPSSTRNDTRSYTPSSSSSNNSSSGSSSSGSSSGSVSRPNRGG